ncbi:MAG: RMD1 family protein [Candidatus Buchananbacteria bacterium]
MQIKVKAYDIARSADLGALRAIKFGKLVNDSPVIFQTKEKFLVIFDYGVAVFFNYERAEIVRAINVIRQHVVGYKSSYAKDDFVIVVGKPSLPSSQEALGVKDLTLDEIKLVSIVLSRSVALEYYENLIDDLLEKLAPIVERLSKKGNTRRTTRSLRKQIGLALAVQHELAYNLEILDDPDVVWSSGQKVDELFHELAGAFDLAQRVQILEKKLKIISDANNFLIDQVQIRQAHTLEWIVILLIAFEIVWALWQQFLV